MKALSLIQPWAWLVVHGGKNIENRKWNTKFRGRFLVHASKAMHLLDNYAAAVEFAARVAPELAVPEPAELLRGGIIGSVELFNVLPPYDPLRLGIRPEPWHFTHQYGFCLRDPEPLPFRPCRGALNFWQAAETA